MEITGNIIQVLAERGGTSARTGNTWKVQEYVIQTDEQYPKTMVFEVFGDDNISKFNIQVGQYLTVSFDVDAHEYQGRWYNQIRAWKVTPAQAPAQPISAPVPAPSQPTSAPTPPADFTPQEGDSELPF